MVYSQNEMSDKTFNNSPWGVAIAVCMRRTIPRMLLPLKKSIYHTKLRRQFVLCLEPFLDIYQLCIKINLKVKMRKQKWNFMTLLDKNVQIFENTSSEPEVLSSSEPNLCSVCADHFLSSLFWNHILGPQWSFVVPEYIHSSACHLEHHCSTFPGGKWISRTPNTLQGLPVLSHI